ncbi:hypothetical protein KP509_24G078900 [Ceratopteris richardii]|nr:hypothetical protein KP509_24G078900 [Ceratopteris richardii]KAH7300798.1 hypothetical protein KP509_24G078900 [Ceratopteris richardii]KAH7300800.1 hypothetical protein KP509_24G078900 [Ceratopteris richardii]
MLELSKSLEKALVLVKKCKRSSVLRRVMNMISLSDFRKVNSALEGAIGDVTWLLNASAHRLNGKRGGMEGLPPIASTDPMLAWVWCQVALVHGGNPAEKEEGASYLASLASDNDRNRKIITEEGGVPPLLRLLKEGTSVSGRIAAANAIGVLAVDTQRVQHIYDCGACPVFVHILQDGPMKVQAKIAWLIGKMLARAPEAQDAFATESIIRPLVSLLVFETMDSNPTHKTLRSITMHNLSRGSPTSMSPSGEGKAGRTPMKSVRSVKLDDRWDAQSINSELNSDRPCGSPDVFAATKETKRLPIRHSRGFSDSYYFQGISSRELLRKERDNEDPETKHDLKVQVTFALWKLAENNVDSCRKIADTKALICLAKLIESEKDGDIVRNSVMTVMEIAAAAERSVELRRSAFKTTLPAAKAVVDQLLRMIEEGDWDLRLPCLRAVGCLSRTFPARETKVIGPLVHQLSHTELGIAGEAAQALQKFAQTDNFLHLEHSKAIVDAGALPHLVRLVSSEDKDVQMPALMLLCYLSMNAGNNEVFRETATLKVLKGLLRTSVCQIQAVNEILPAAMQHLELYQSARHSFRKY